MEGTLTLPKVRRWRRPPARLVYHALWVMLALWWLFICAIVLFVQTNLLAMVWIPMWSYLATTEIGQLSSTWRSWERNERTRPVIRLEWAELVGSYLLLFSLLIVASL